MITFRQTLVAKSVRLVVAVAPAESRDETVKKLHERYHFQRVPRTFEELFPTDPNVGIVFEHGRMDRENRPSILIDMLQLRPNMILAQTHTSTDDADEFLDDYIRNANREYSDRIRVYGAPFYSSEVEFVWDKSLDHFAPRFASAAQAIDALLTSYGSHSAPFRVVSVQVNYDLTRATIANPTLFSIERRAGAPDSENIFYSQAPLKTTDHLAALQAIDRE